MNYFSTRDKSLKFSFKDIFLRGLAPGGGLFLPAEIKKYNQEDLNNLSKLNYNDLATEIILNFCPEEIKKNERKHMGKAGFLDDIPHALPANKRALKLQKRASAIGFDWKSSAEVLYKIFEELGELEQEIDSGDNSCIENELGDLLFTVINLSRHLQIDPESAPRKANRKFTMRFDSMEKLAPENDITKLSQDELDEMWLLVKSLE